MYRFGVVRKTFLAGTLSTITSVLLWTSCGGYMSSGGIVTPPPGSTAAVVNITDSPSDRVVSFEVTINSLTLIASDGSSVVVFNTPRRLEVTHSSGSAEPLGVTVFPQGTFTSAKVVVSSPDVTFIDDSGHTVEKQNAGSTSTITIPFSPALVVGTTPTVLTIDFNAAGSININLGSNSVTVNPTAEGRHDDVPRSGGEAGEDVENGEFEHFIGQVTGISGSNFTVNANGTSITFATNSSTSFEEGATLGSITVNAMIRVEARTQQNGTPLATEVELLSQIANESEGIITSTTGSPVTSFKFVVQDGAGSGMNDAMLGSALTINLNDQTRFRVDDGNIDLGGLNLPDFNASSLSRGQRVEADADAAPASGAVTAESVKLQSQALTGVISNASGSQFTLTLPDDSAFKLLTGNGTLTVLTQSNTELKNNASITNGAVVKVRGLVFFDPNANSFTMVAGRISTP
jgi:hypothetical protein